ncbi:MAG: LPP20 family lipoprotein, partial [Spirochaetales bacterium]|nr:LPP20 family lipoprotein [Spirochaetales bacterium]
MIKRYIFALLSLIAIFLLVVSCVSTPPDWYLDREADSGFITGMGEGETREIAKANALREIAEQLEVRISAKTVVVEKEYQGEFSLLFEQNIEAATDIVLSGTEVVMEEKCGGLYYVTYRYDNRPLRIRVLDTAHNGEITSLTSGMESSFQQFLPFSRFLRENKVPGNFMLSRNNDVWNVSVGNRTFAVSGREFAKDFFNAGGDGEIALVQGFLNGSAIIGQPVDTLRQGQTFLLSITPAITGFLTLLYVDNAGIVVSLLENG